MTVAARRLSLHDTSDLLALDSVRLYRLGRYLHLTPGDPCLPPDVIVCAQAEQDGEERYRIVLAWLLDALQHDSCRLKVCSDGSTSTDRGP